MSAETQLKSYDTVAGFYDTVSGVFSFGQISATKSDQLNYLSPGDEVLFIGCGGGMDVLAAAKKGCRVTAVDTSQQMLNQLQRRLQLQNLDATLICDRVENLEATACDAVCANFFLNCFAGDKMESLLVDIVKHVKPGGKLMIADVAPPTGNILSRSLNRFYLHGAMLPFWMMGMVQWHANHDYVRTLEKMGWQVTEIRTFRLLRVAGPVVFRNIVANRN